MSARRVAVDALVRIERDDAYANLALPAALDRSALDQRDRAFVTELVYGVTRMRRALDWVIDGFLSDTAVDPVARAALRVGAYQVLYLGTPPHAAVGETVAVVPRRLRGFINAVLRRVADARPEWPSDAVRLSYPDWLVDRLETDLGRDDAVATLDAMNQAPTVTIRADGYVQDRASTWVAEAVGANEGDRVLDTCAAPGGKATAVARAGGRVVAGDVSATRARLIAANAATVGLVDRLGVVVGDGRRLPVPPGSFDRVLVDAPCTGLGVLGRRADARWRIEADAVERLAMLQRELLGEAIGALGPGGTLVYSVCTMTSEETLGIDRWLASNHSDLAPLEGLDAPWRPHGRGSLLLPSAAGTDGMYVLRLRSGRDPSSR